MSQEHLQPKVSIDGEHDTQTGWLYTMTIAWTDGSTSDHELTMAWVDHEHLVGGSISPSLIAKQAASIAAAHFGAKQLPLRFDISSLRRHIKDFDELFRDQ